MKIFSLFFFGLILACSGGSSNNSDMMKEEIIAADYEYEEAPLVEKTIAGADEPGISTNEIITKLLVSDGDIVVIGGIKKNTINDTRTKTPGLSKVPVLGNLFKGKQKTDELKELLIFIAPRVID